MTGHLTTVVVGEAGEGLYMQKVDAAGHALVADEPTDIGGDDKGPAPYGFLLSALGACTSMTLRMYANQKKWEVTKISVTLTHKKEADRKDVVTREITLEGNLDEAQRQRLLEIANKCPVHRTLMEEPRPLITSSLR